MHNKIKISVPLLCINATRGGLCFFFFLVLLYNKSNGQIPISGCQLKPVEKSIGWDYFPWKDSIKRDYIEHHILQPRINSGYTFDIDSLDNSFNMEINGVKLATKEIQFQGNISSSENNIMFKDGDRYGHEVGEIYNMTGSKDYPILRIKINKEGKVSMFGAKRDSGDLHPLILYNGNAFNRIPWDSLGQNRVVVTQMVQSKTNMGLHGYGKSKQCTFFIAVPDISQTPEGKKVRGNVLTNDKGFHLRVRSATCLDENGDKKQIEIGESVPVYNKKKTLSGQFVLEEDGQYVFIPEIGFNGHVTISYFAEDQNNYTQETSLTLRVIPMAITERNNDPVAQNDVIYTKEAVSLSSTVLSNDADPDKDNLTIEQMKQDHTVIPIGSVVHLSGIDREGNSVSDAGTFVWNKNGTFTFQPVSGFLGKIDPLSYVLDDGHNGSDSAILNIGVLKGLGNQTFANDDAHVAVKGEEMSGNVLENDNDPEGDQQKVIAITIEGEGKISVAGQKSIVLPGKGNFLIKSNGDYQFNPESSFIGTVPITYSLKDDGLPNNNSRATLYLTSVDTLAPPVAHDDKVVNQVPGRRVIVPVMNNDTPQGYIDSSTISLIDTVGGSSSEDTDGDGTIDKVNVPGEGVWLTRPEGKVVFLPESHFTDHPTPIGYTVENIISEKSNPATITIKYSQKPPEANKDSVHADTLDIPITLSLLNNDKSMNGRGLDPSSIDLKGPQGSIPEETDNNGRTDRLRIPKEGIWGLSKHGEVVFTPEKGMHDNPTPIHYTIEDSAGFRSNPALIIITYTRILPIAHNDIKSDLPVGKRVSIDVIDNDEVGNGGGLDPSSISLMNPSGHSEDRNGDGRIDKMNISGEGVWKTTPDGKVLFTPNANFFDNPDKIKYTVMDESGQESNAAIISLSVKSDIYFPNMFSPNSDGHNDIWKAYSNTVQNIDIIVYNQYGQKIFESKNIAKGWDGRYRGVAQPTGVYVFFAKVTFTDGTTMTKKGSITLIK